MHALGDKISDDDVSTLIAAADKDGDGKVNYEEFIKMMVANE